MGIYLKPEKNQEGDSGRENCLKLIQKKVDRVESMTELLYEIKAETTLGRIAVVLINRFIQEDSNPFTKINLCGVSLAHLAGLAEATEEELKQAIDYLQQKGIIAR